MVLPAIKIRLADASNRSGSAEPTELSANAADLPRITIRLPSRGASSSRTSGDDACTSPLHIEETVGGHSEGLVTKPTSRSTRPRKQNASRKRVREEEYDGTVVVGGQVLQTTKAFDTFWQYTAERQAVENKRRAGMPAP